MGNQRSTKPVQAAVGQARVGWWIARGMRRAALRLL